MTAAGATGLVSTLTGTSATGATKAGAIVFGAVAKGLVGAGGASTGVIGADVTAAGVAGTGAGGDSTGIAGSAGVALSSAIAAGSTGAVRALSWVASAGEIGTCVTAGGATATRVPCARDTCSGLFCTEPDGAGAGLAAGIETGAATDLRARLLAIQRLTCDIRERLSSGADSAFCSSCTPAAEGVGAENCRPSTDFDRSFDDAG